MGEILGIVLLFILAGVCVYAGAIYHSGVFRERNPPLTGRLLNVLPQAPPGTYWRLAYSKPDGEWKLSLRVGGSAHSTEFDAALLTDGEVDKIQLSFAGQKLLRSYTRYRAALDRLGA